MLYNPKFNITPKINKALSEIERVRGFLDAVNLKQTWIKAIQQEALISESHYSTHIEGTALSLTQAKHILTGKEVAGIRPDDRKELLNYKTALDFIMTYLGKEDPMTEGLIWELHEILVTGVRGDAANPGKYRKKQNYVVNGQTGQIIYTPPPALEVPILMRDLVDWLNQVRDISPILIAGIAQFQLVYIHPFIDGNGRTARILATLILYKNGYDFKQLFSLSEYYDQNRPAYYQALQSVSAPNLDMTEWLEYFVTGLHQQLLHVREKGERAIRFDAILQRIESLELNLRQRKVV
ncbi:MAG: Fic family protein, partial [bacterium]|nr:Fic family protein [bacterium]